MVTHYAHSLPNKAREDWHELDKHLGDTARLADEFAADFAPGWGYLAGLWHDLGKYQKAFQRRIEQDANAHADIKVDHSSVGALVAHDKRAGPLSFVIAGHHGGLSNKQDLLARLKEKRALLEVCRSDGMPMALEDQVVPSAPSFANSDSRKLALWIRFLFSALVDADFLDTERFYKGSIREFRYESLSLLRSRLVAYRTELAGKARKTVINQLRKRVGAACRKSALLEPGAFTLTVPTGGGKTLSAMQFALDHAVEHGHRRVIVVIPFTSIIEQTARVYRGVFGEDNVVEHHSNVDPDCENRLNRLASENWDAPIIVTTSVQFFESLYGNRPSRCRKLHRIARSVVVFDEVQTVPAGLLEPIRDVLVQLMSDYGVTAVFCTATQPALDIPATREILPNVAGEFAITKDRCEYHFPETAEPVSWERLAAEISKYHAVLAIVNKRADAQELAKLVGDHCIHLSARMCAAHRSKVISDIKEVRLPQGRECRVVSTQLVEAGVDIDFPVVFRAFAGADSLAQAAGRCNREGQQQKGHVFIFQPPSEPPRGILRQAKQRAASMWKEGRLDLNDPETFREFFRRLYSTVETDPGVLQAERELCFSDSAQLFNMIEDVGEAVVAPYGTWLERVAEIRWTGVTRNALRRLQPYLVKLYPQEITVLRTAGALEELESGLWVVVPGYEHVYDERFGFTWSDGITAEPESLIV